MSDKNTHNIVTFDLDDEYVEVVRAHIELQNGRCDYSGAVRFIIRDHKQISGFKPTARRTTRKPVQRALRHLEKAVAQTRPE